MTVQTKHPAQYYNNMIKKKPKITAITNPAANKDQFEIISLTYEVTAPIALIAD